MGVLLEILGEVPDDTTKALKPTIINHITSSSTAVRHQAAAVAAALSLAQPPAASQLLGSCLEALETGAQQLCAMAAPYNKLKGEIVITTGQGEDLTPDGGTRSIAAVQGVLPLFCLLLGGKARGCIIAAVQEAD